MPEVDKIDFNGGSVAEESGQSEKTETQEEKETIVEEKTEETKEESKDEDVDSLPEWAKEKLTKLERDKENYKKGMLKHKERTLEIEKEQNEEEEEEYPEWDEASKKFQKQTVSEAEKRAEAKAQAIIEKTNEKSAIAQFIVKHPDLSEEERWNDVISNYHSKNGKDTVDSVLKDLERAYVITRYESGELTKLQEEAVKKEVAKQKLDELSTVSNTGSKAAPKGTTLSKSALKMAEKMRVDPKKLAEEDDSLTAEINF